MPITSPEAELNTSLRFVVVGIHFRLEILTQFSRHVTMVTALVLHRGMVCNEAIWFKITWLSKRKEAEENNREQEQQEIGDISPPPSKIYIQVSYNE